jgi:hypothetical protein
MTQENILNYMKSSNGLHSSPYENEDESKEWKFGDLVVNSGGDIDHLYNNAAERSPNAHPRGRGGHFIPQLPEIGSTIITREPKRSNSWENDCNYATRSRSSSVPEQIERQVLLSTCSNDQKDNTIIDRHDNLLTKKKNLYDMFQELQIEPYKPRYRRRSMERRSAMCTINHPHFDLMPRSLSADCSITSKDVSVQPQQFLNTTSGDDSKQSLSNNKSQNTIEKHHDRTYRRQSDFAITYMIEEHAPSSLNQQQQKHAPSSVPLTSKNHQQQKNQVCDNDREENEDIQKRGKIQMLKSHSERPRKNQSFNLSHQLHRSLSLPKHIINFFNSNKNNDEFEDIKNSTQSGYSQSNALLETLKRNHSQNILNVVKNCKVDDD